MIIIIDNNNDNVFCQLKVENEHAKQYVAPAKDEDQLYMQLCHARNIKSESLM